MRQTGFESLATVGAFPTTVATVGIVALVIQLGAACVLAARRWPVGARAVAVGLVSLAAVVALGLAGAYWSVLASLDDRNFVDAFVAITLPYVIIGLLLIALLFAVLAGALWRGVTEDRQIATGVLALVTLGALGSATWALILVDRTNRSGERSGLVRVVVLGLAGTAVVSLLIGASERLRR